MILRWHVPLIAELGEQHLRLWQNVLQWCNQASVHCSILQAWNHIPFSLVLTDDVQPGDGFVITLTNTQPSLQGNVAPHGEGGRAGQLHHLHTPDFHCFAPGASYMSILNGIIRSSRIPQRQVRCFHYIAVVPVGVHPGAYGVGSKSGAK